jgi:hypothetical protein
MEYFDRIVTVVIMLTGVGALIFAALDRYRPRTGEVSPMRQNAPAVATDSDAPTPQLRNPWRAIVSGLLGAALIGAAIARIWFEPMPTGFNSPWPDAISCKFTEPESATPSETIFYYKGTGAARNQFGSVVIYLLVGGQNSIVPGETVATYFPHEIWFSNDEKKALLNPKDVPITALSSISNRYKLFFIPDLNCGGTTIDEIKAAHKAFYFAKH